MHDFIPVLDLKRQYHQIKNEVLINIQKVFEDAEFTEGPFVKSFEKSFAQYCGTKNAVAVNSGTSALHLAVKVLGIGKGDEIIIPANTFIASTWGAIYEGAKPVFVDCLPDTWQIDTEQLEKAITSKTKAVVGVHMYGQPCDVSRISQIAKENNIYFIEDAAHAGGASFSSKKVGSFGDLGCFSFYPSKNLGTYGEGGCITSHIDELNTRLRVLKNQGSSDKYTHKVVGHNMRMGAIEAAVLNVKLQYLDQWNDKRRAIASQYFKRMQNPKIRFQHQPTSTASSFHLFVVATKDREALQKHLSENNIGYAVHYPIPCHLQPVFDNLGYKKGDLPNAEYLADHCLSIPMFAELTGNEVERIVEVMNAY